MSAQVDAVNIQITKDLPSHAVLPSGHQQLKQLLKQKPTCHLNLEQRKARRRNIRTHDLFTLKCSYSGLILRKAYSICAKMKQLGRLHID